MRPIIYIYHVPHAIASNSRYLLILLTPMYAANRHQTVLSVCLCVWCLHWASKQYNKDHPAGRPNSCASCVRSYSYGRAADTETPFCRVSYKFQTFTTLPRTYYMLRCDRLLLSSVH